MIRLFAPVADAGIGVVVLVTGMQLRLVWWLDAAAGRLRLEETGWGPRRWRRDAWLRRGEAGLVR